MTAEIITLPVIRVERGGGDTPRDRVIEVVRDWLERVHPARTAARLLVDKAESDAALPDADYFLAWLWDEGFKIEPIE